MSDFIVSARKYRPATFSSVVGQKHITSTLKNAIERGQLAHAYLFCGPRGVGKTTCARIFAKAINCLHPEGAEACNTCESCRSFNDGRSLNIHELDAASNNSVEDIRSLIEQVRIIPQVGRYSVFIIDEVHMLSAAAFNAFLKTLEEPPATRHLHPGDHRKTQDHPYDPLALPDLRLQPHPRRGLRGIPQIHRLAGGNHRRRRVAQPDRTESRRRHARRPVDVRQGRFVLRAGTPTISEVAQTLNVLDYDTYFSMTETLLVGQLCRGAAALSTTCSRGDSPARLSWRD